MLKGFLWVLEGFLWLLKGWVLANVVAFFVFFVLAVSFGLPGLPGLRDTARTPYWGLVFGLVSTAFFVVWCVIGRKRPWVLKGFLWVLVFLVLANVVVVFTVFALRSFGLRDTAQTYGGFVGAAAFIGMCVIGWRRRGADTAAVRGRLVSLQRSPAAEKIKGQ